MYTIVNTSGRHLSIQDLRIVLSPRERIDLDTVCERRDIESSVQLKHALRKGYVKVVIKDKEGFDASVNIKKSSGITKEDLDKIKIEVMAMIKETISQIKDNSIGNREISEISSLKNEVEIDEKVLEKIHKKAVNRLMSKTDGSLSVNESKSDSNILNKKVDELEGLI